MGAQYAGKLARLGIHTVQDLLFHLPLRYEDRTRVTPVGALQPGCRALVVARIEYTGVSYGRRRSLVARVSDGTGSLALRLFHFTAAQQHNLRGGRWVRCFGEVRSGPERLEMIHPEYRLSDEAPTQAEDPHLTPVYPTTEGISQQQLRRLVDQALASHLPAVVELLPQRGLRELGFPPLREALEYLHHPPATGDVGELQAGQHACQQRLAFEELLAHHLSLRLLRDRRQVLRAPALGSGPAEPLQQQFLMGLGFEPTAAQRRVSGEIARDLARPLPMLRLLQGDVGSGKTVVAALAALQVAAQGCQCAIMAPTELLAEQHLRTFRGWLEDLPLQVGWLSGQLPVARRRRTLAELAAGSIDVLVGTHALFQKGVEFARLGLVVVDEQHRFGVHQRLALWDKGQQGGEVPHQLIMTATPIPRTLAMTFYADLDVSSLDELPPGRQPVETVVVPESRRREVVARVESACRAGRQVYWVCPLIDESEVLEVQAASATAEALTQALPGLAVALVHGRLPGREKERVMQRFRDGEVQVLVATTVIEVGVDVPQASLMIIENAERLGLAQLHQLRGRVGRGSEHAVCVLLYRAPLSDNAKIRLSALRETNDGFEIARQDLELRGPGEVLGTRQTGLQRLRIADLARDRALLPQVQAIARQLLKNQRARVPLLIDRWIGRGGDYGHV